jgi:hypothetical protein
MRAFYYYYYLFYKKIWDPDPRLAATLGLTALEGFFSVAILNLTLARFFCIDFNIYCFIAVFAIILLANTFYFFTSEKVKVILKAKPKFFNSPKLTIALVLVFSLAVISTLFWTGDYTNHILARCH